MSVIIERASFGTVGYPTREEIAVKLRGAPEWLRRGQTAPKQGQPSKAFQERLRDIYRGHVGWVAGVVAPGVSVPAFSKRDGKHLPEQFTPRCWEAVLQQVSDPSSKVPLTWRHGGAVVAEGGDLTFRLHRHPFMGLCFEARLKDRAQSKICLDAIGAGGLGVSIGFNRANQWHVERKGIGTVRVVDGCTIDHIALVPTGEGQSPAYPAARAYAVRSKDRTCPAELVREAELFSWAEIRRQFGAEL